jgi:hypothetical protein
VIAAVDDGAELRHELRGVEVGLLRALRELAALAAALGVDEITASSTPGLSPVASAMVGVLVELGRADASLIDAIASAGGRTALPEPRREAPSTSQGAQDGAT